MLTEKTYNIYCDESCHLRNDSSDVMILGGIRCPENQARSINNEINDIKAEFGIDRAAEIKWTKVSPGMIDFYRELVDYFFKNDALYFRGYIARGKSEIRCESNSEYNEWYYKMYYRMLEYILDHSQGEDYNIYIDIKDTVGAEKVNKLRQYLNSHYCRNIVSKAQLVDSSDVALLQLADLFIGALSYRNRRLTTSSAKIELLEYIEKKSGQSLLASVPYKYQKANWFVWVPNTWR